MAAILTQVDNTGERRVVTYASRSLTDVERRYSQTEREALAVVWACEYLHIYIYGKPVTVYTDHNPLLSIYGNPASKPPARLERWALRLQPYQLTVKYMKGDSNPADYLSRNPSKYIQSSRQQQVAEEYVNYIVQTSSPKALPLQAVREAITDGNWHMMSQRPGINMNEFTLLQRVKDELTVCSEYDVILRGTRIVIPSKLQEHVVKLAHEGHQGVVKTKSLLREKVWFPGIDRMVENEVKSCAACLVSTPEFKREPLHMSPLPTAPWDEVSIDFAELPNKQYLLLITDDYSRYPIVEVVRSTAASVVIPQIDKVFSEFGIPSIVKSDNGPPFNGNDFCLFAKSLGFKHRKITPVWPRANGEVERLVRTVKKIVKTSQIEKKNFKQELNRFLRNYRATPHSTTRVPPATAIFARSMKIKIPEMATFMPDEDMVKRDREAKAKMKAHADNNRNVKPCPLKEGDMVLVKRNDSKRKSDTPYHEDPFKVVQKKGTMITAKAEEGRSITRNSSWFKRMPETKNPLELEENQKESEEETLPMKRYPERIRRAPDRLNYDHRIK